MRTKPLCYPKEEAKRLERAKERRERRWTEAGDKPSGRSVRQLRRAQRAGYAPNVIVKNPDKYLNSHARQMAALKRGLAARLP